jgi:hypothetical protein
VDVVAEIERSNQEILRTVWPVLRPRMGGGDLHPVTGGLGEQLDRDTGFDMLWRRDELTFAVATRCQWFRTSYDTFTIRTRTSSGSRNTEFVKRLNAVSAGAMFPQYTIQSYVHPDGGLIAAAMCRTDSLFDAVERRIMSSFTWPEIRNPDGSAFVAIPWAAVNPAHILVIRGGDS